MRGLNRDLICVRAAREAEKYRYVFIGGGLPVRVPGFADENIEVMFFAENGVLGYTGFATDEEKDFDIIDPFGYPVVLRPGACFMHTVDSLALMKTGRVELAVLGAYQVSEKGDLASEGVAGVWAHGIGGAADIARGAKRVLVIMEHNDLQGNPKIVREINYPLTASNVVNTILTNLGVIEVTSEGLLLREIASGITPEEVQEATEPELRFSPDLKEMEI